MWNEPRPITPLTKSAQTNLPRNQNAATNCGQKRPTGPQRSQRPQKPDIRDWTQSSTGKGSGKNIPAHGDPILDRSLDDNIVRFASNNINGSTVLHRGLEVSTDIDTTNTYGIDIMALQETLKPWTGPNIRLYNQQCKHMWPQGSRNVFSSAPHEHGDSERQAGGTLLSINGKTKGRVSSSGSDPWGRFCWFTLRGARDEGILVVCVYRVCQTKEDNPGIFTAYHQQYSGLRSIGIKDPNPRQQVLLDLIALIDEKRQEGYRPIIMMDANEDWVNESHKKQGNKLKKFMNEATLVDAFYEKFKYSPRTYVDGRHRLDYILIDPALLQAVKYVGHLDSLEGNCSDHSMVYVDFDEKLLFKGLINRPTDLFAREILLEQSDKKLRFTTLARTYFIQHKIAERVFKLAAMFAEHGATALNMQQYRKLDDEIIELTIAAAKKSGRKNFGYTRSEDLTTAGQMLILLKCLMNCKLRNQPITEGCKRSAERLKFDLDFYNESTFLQLRKRVFKQRRELWTIQKECDDRRIQWIEKIAEDRTRAEGDSDWQKKMNDMKRKVKESQVNNKLRAVLKGTHSQLDRIQIPTGDWYHSEKECEIFHYDHGVWEAYPRMPRYVYRFLPHHTLKVIPTDAKPIKVRITDEYIDIDEWLDDTGPMWRDITRTDDIADLLIHRNKRHLQQTDIEGGISKSEAILKVRSEHGLSKFNDDILAGKAMTTVDTTPEVLDWFKAIARDPNIECPPVTGVITKEDYQEMFKNATEKTSSGGKVHYTLWKALAEQDDFAEFLCIMMSLPFMFGFANPRWSNEIDVMLEKKPGVRMIHLLRIIGLLEADFNTALKFLFAKQMMDNAELIGISEEQWGSRKNRSSIDAAMLKLLMFETARVKRGTLGAAYYDLVANYDRIYKSVSNLMAQRCMVDKNVLLARALVLDRMRRHVKTALGTSKKSYGQEKGEAEVGGEVQGKGDVPSLWCVQSDTLLRAHAMGAYGMCFANPEGTREIKRYNTQFVDDDDGWASAPFDSPNPTSETMHRLQHDAQRWNNINNIPGQTVAFHKTKWQMLAWQTIKGDLEIVKSTEDTLVLKDNKGGAAVIEFLPPDQPNKGLGYLLCPSGNQEPQFRAVLDAVKEICDRVVGAQLSEQETKQALFQRLLPKLDYSLQASYFTEKQCTTIDKAINAAFLPRLRINRNTKRDVVYGPGKYGGLELPDCHTRQTQHHIKYMLKHLRWNQTVGGDIITTLDNIQLASGFVTPILEKTDPPIDYIDNGWILDLRRRLHKIGATMWIEDAWQPKLQREGDYSLMERFLLVHSTPSERKSLRAVLHWLRVTTVADLADPTGRYIDGCKLTGEWQANSRFEWPRQPKPTKKAFATFRKFIRNTICLDASPWQPILSTMTISEPLGKWLPVQRNVIETCSRTRDSLYYRDEESGVIGRFDLNGDCGLFKFAEEVTKDDIPLEAHPIDCRFVDGDKIWTSRRHRLSKPKVMERPPPGKVLFDSLNREAKRIKGASDGSLFREEKTMAAGWLFGTGPDDMLSATFVISGITSLSSYRAELEGTFRLLKHIEFLGMTPEEVIQWCDNEGAVTATNKKAFYTPSEMLAPDADIILAIMHHKKNAMFSSSCNHVLSHQDTKQRKSKEEKLKEKKERKRERRNRIREVDVGEGTHAPSPPPTPPQSPIIPENATETNVSPITVPTRELRCKPLSDEVQMNVACDEIAGEAARDRLEHPEAPLPPALQPPYAGSKAMLKIGKVWITSDYDKHIHFASRVKQIKKYCRHRHNWSKKTMKLIDWSLIAMIRKRKKKQWPAYVTTMKVMHGWLPLMHNIGKYKSITQCPGCDCQDETYLHLFSCQHPLMKETLAETLAQVHKQGMKSHMKRHFMDKFIKYIECGIAGEKIPVPTEPIELKRAILDQNLIGTDKLLQGFIAKSWAKALPTMGSAEKHVPSAMRSLLILIWDTLFQRMWDTRNHILHRLPNNYKIAEGQSYDNRLRWYNDNCHKVLHEKDRLLVPSIEEIENMGRLTKRKWVQQLDKLRKYSEQEGNLLDKGQTAITSHFKPSTQSAPTLVVADYKRKKRTTKSNKKPNTKKTQTKLTVIKKISRNNSRANQTNRPRSGGNIITPDNRPKSNRPSYGDNPRPPEGLPPD